MLGQGRAGCAAGQRVWGAAWEGDVMPPESGHPGVYVEEVPRPRMVVGVPTSVCAFVGRTGRGRVDTPVMISNFAEFRRRFGGLWAGSTLGFAVRDFFGNGGSMAVIVRVFAAPAGGPAGDGRAVLRLGTLRLVAADPGSWGNQLRVRVDHATRAPQADLGETAGSLFNLTVHDGDSGAVAEYRDVTVGIPGHPRELGAVLASESDLIRMVAPEAGVITSRPVSHEQPSGGQVVWASDATSTGVDQDPLDRGTDGDPLTPARLLGASGAAQRTGLYALDDADLFSLLVLAPDLPGADVHPVVVSAAHAYCEQRRAMLLLDAPTSWTTASDVALPAADTVGTIGANAALYFPRIRAANPLQNEQVEQFPAAGAVAGVLARTDAQRGVWTSPAGRAATLRGVSGLAVDLTAEEVGTLTLMGVNCLRQDPAAGPVVWGARTAAGADATGPPWRYLSVRRTALFIEDSVVRSIQWVVFEPNGEPLWASIRATVTTFLDSLFRAGAFQGVTAKDAYFVRCDRSTTTQADIDRGVVNIVIGFAALIPAEFVIIGIQQASASQM